MSDETDAIKARGYEGQLQHLREKDELHRFIDELPDDVQGIIITQEGTIAFGYPTFERLVFLVSRWLHFKFDWSVNSSD